MANTRTEGESMPRSGRPKLTGRYEEGRILRVARRNPKITYTELRDETGFKFSKLTFYRVLRKHNITNWLIKKRPFLTKEHARLRYIFALRYRN